MRIALLVMRSAVWATLVAGGITSLIVWRTSPEMPMTRHVVATLFGIMWALCLVPSMATEFLVAHLKLELGEVNDRKTNG
jgi:multisubunit Na+/H+ antiporter MnhE subunit